MSETFPDPVFPDPPTDPEPVPDGPEILGWEDTAEQVAGRMVPRIEDHAPTLADGEGVPAGTGWNQYDGTSGDLMQMWQWDGAAWVALDMSPQMIPVLDIGSATVGDLTGGRINVTDGPIVAGTPGGARVEMASDGLHAYNADGAETATIRGDEGVFVGGEFRTSDALPGQVTLSDTAYTNPHSFEGDQQPGLSITPRSTAGLVHPASIGANFVGASLYSGKYAAGTSSALDLNTDSAQIRTFRADGVLGSYFSTGLGTVFIQSYDTGGVRTSSLNVSETSSRISTHRTDGTTASRINVDANEAYLYTSAGGTGRYLTVDATGIWVKSGAKSYNLEQTAQDSGWQSFSVAAGITASSSVAWRNKGGIIFFRGTVQHASWPSLWTTIATGLPASILPGSTWVCNEAGSGRQNQQMIRVTTAGELSIYHPVATAGSDATYFLTAMTYPAG